MTQQELMECERELEVFRRGPKEAIPDGLANVSYDELEAAVAQLQIGEELGESTDTELLKLDEKMNLNEFGLEAKDLLRRGLEHAGDMNRLVVNNARFKDGKFPEKLLKCFQRAYYDFYSNGKRGDDLMDLMCLRLHALSGKRSDYQCILVMVAYLFERCDLFRKTEVEQRRERSAI